MEGTTVDLGQLSVLVAIIAQTGFVSTWLGRLAQRVQDIKEDMDEIKKDMVGSPVCLMHRAGEERRMGMLEGRVEVLEMGLRMQEQLGAH